MPRPFKLRYVNQLVGSFVLLVVMLLLVVMVLLARRQDWFTPTYRVHTVIPEEQLDGIRKGTEVLLLGRRVGEVDHIEYIDHGRDIVVTLRIRTPFQGQIFDDSLLHLRHRLAGAGEAYLEIMRGPKSRRALADGESIRLVGAAEPAHELRRVAGMMDDIRQSFEDVRNAMVPAFEQFQATTQHIDDSNRQLQAVLRDLEKLTPRMHSLTDQAEGVLDGGQQVVDDLREVTPRLEPLTRQTEEVLQTSQQVADNLRAESEELTGAAGRLQDGLEGAQDVIDGLKRHWLLRRWVDQGEPNRLIPPSDVGRAGSYP